MNSTKKISIAVTGNIGSGKSTVAAVFEKLGAYLIEGDVLGRRVVEESSEFRKWLKVRYGSEIFDGENLDRAALGRIVFRDNKARQDLDKNIWPYIDTYLQKELESISKISVFDAALIYEWGIENRFDKVIVVDADPEQAIERAASRIGISSGEIRDRQTNQIPDKDKISKADIVIENSGSLSQLESKAQLVYENQIESLLRNN